MPAADKVFPSESKQSYPSEAEAELLFGATFLFIMSDVNDNPVSG